MASEDNSAGSEAWLKSQASYWDAWFQFCKQAAATGAEKQGALPWSTGLDNWWSTVAGQVPGAGQDFFQRIVEQGKSFIGFGEKFSDMYKGLQPADFSEWQKVLQAALADMKTRFENPNSFDPASYWTGVLPFLEQPLTTWNRTLASARLFPADFLKSFTGAGVGSAAEHMRSQIGQLLSTPGVGYTREWQESAQQAGKLYLEYEQALDAYNKMHARLSIDALEQLLAKMQGKAAAGEELKSLRELYDLWVDCSEEEFNKLALSEEYGAVYGKLINALMRLKKHNQQMADGVAKALHLPTNQGLATLQARQQELRRELSRLRAVVNELNGAPVPAASPSAALDVAELQDQLTDLASKVSALERTGARDAAPAEPVNNKPAEPKRTRAPSTRAVKSSRTGGQ